MPNGKRGRGRGRAPSTRALMRAHDSGRRLRVPPNPPSVVETPWNSIILQFTGNGDKTLTGKKIVSVLQAQTGFTNAVTVGYDMKVRSIRVWSLAAGHPIRASFFGFDNTATADGGALAVLDDYPSPITWAAVGYEFPVSAQNVVYSEDSTAKFCSIDIGGNNGWLAYIDLLWRGNKYTPFTQTARYLASRGGLQMGSPESSAMITDAD